MVKAPHLIKGQLAEQQAEVIVTEAGLTVIAKNVNTRYGELDLVCQYGKELIFIEVRYRSNNSFGSAAESVTISKQRKLTKAAQYFVLTNSHLSNLFMRFDVIGLDANNKAQWIKGAFSAAL